MGNKDFKWFDQNGKVLHIQVLSVRPYDVDEIEIVFRILEADRVLEINFKP